MFTRQNLPPKVGLIVLAFDIPNSAIHDLTIESMNGNDGHGVWSDLKRLAQEHCDDFYRSNGDQPSPHEYFSDNMNQLSFAMHGLLP